MFQIYFTTNNSLVVELNQTKAVEIVNAYNGKILKDGWTYIGTSFMALYYPTNKNPSLYQSKMCAYLWGPQSYEK
jgi:hypothetical protein